MEENAERTREDYLEILNGLFHDMTVEKLEYYYTYIMEREKE